MSSSSSSSRHNSLLVCIGIVGDPITAFVVDAESQYLVTGSANGQILLWKLDKGEIDTNIKNSQYICRVLSVSSDECIKHFILSPNLFPSLLSVIGDAHLKVFRDLFPEEEKVADRENAPNHEYSIIKLDRQHTYASCSNSYSFHSYDSNSQLHHVLTLHPGNEQQHEIKVKQKTLANNENANGTIDELKSLIQQVPILYRFPVNSIPVYYSATNNKILLLQTKADNGQKILLMDEWPLKQQFHSSFVPSVPIPLLSFPSSHKHYWGFQLANNFLAHICCHNKIKVYKINNNTCALVHKLVVHKDRVISFLLFANDSSCLIISLGADNKVKIHRDGQLIYKVKNVKGIFRLNYPYLLQVQKHSNLLFYTADEGLFALRIPKQIQIY